MKSRKQFEEFHVDWSIGIDDEIVQEAIEGILLGEWDTENSMLEQIEVQLYEHAGVTTHSRGLVITLPDGSKYQLAIEKIQNADNTYTKGGIDCGAGRGHAGSDRESTV